MYSEKRYTKKYTWMLITQNLRHNENLLNLQLQKIWIQKIQHDQGS